MLLGEGRGFEISQVRLGPGRIHHCMRRIGAAEKALELMVTRGVSREAFGTPDRQARRQHREVIAGPASRSRPCASWSCGRQGHGRLGNHEARVWVSAVKAMVPEKVCQIIDQAIQMHGAAGVSQWTPLADMYAQQRTLRLADGPDEVHHMVVGRAEIARYS